MFCFKMDALRRYVSRMIKEIKSLKKFQLKTLQLLTRKTNWIHNQPG